MYLRRCAIELTLQRKGSCRNNHVFFSIYILNNCFTKILDDKAAAFAAVTMFIACSWRCFHHCHLYDCCEHVRATWAYSVAFKKFLLLALNCSKCCPDNMSCSSISQRIMFHTLTYTIFSVLPQYDAQDLAEEGEKPGKTAPLQQQWWCPDFVSFEAMHRCNWWNECTTGCAPYFGPKPWRFMLYSSCRKSWKWSIEAETGWIAWSTPRVGASSEIVSGFHCSACRNGQGMHAHCFYSRIPSIRFWSIAVLQLYGDCRFWGVCDIFMWEVK